MFHLDNIVLICSCESYRLESFGVSCLARARVIYEFLWYFVKPTVWVESIDDLATDRSLSGCDGDLISDGAVVGWFCCSGHW